jgi:acrylyl-CoA reductase (NADPH)
MLVEKSGPKQYTRRITTRSIDELPPGDVLIKVAYSSLNYKDALSAIGNKGVTKSYPHTPGIDAAGYVAKSDASHIKKGDKVIVTSYDLGMNTAGGFGEYIRVPAGWVVPLPEGLSLKESMIYGTAGFTAGLAVTRLVSHPLPKDQGPILVTGASGGLGSLAVALLSKIGYLVTAASGKADGRNFLETLGAHKIVSREAVQDLSGRPLVKSQWAGAIDTVGGEILASILKSVNLHGAVSACGNVASFELNTTVFPFILRGISLYGIDSAQCPYAERINIWEKLAGDWKIDHLDYLATEIGLDQLSDYIDTILKGGLKGRVVVKITP